MHLSDDGLTCSHKNCASPNGAVCDACEDGFYRAWDTTACFPQVDENIAETCGADYITYSIAENANINENMCGPICSATQYTDTITKLCGECSLITDCDSCEAVSLTASTQQINCLSCSAPKIPTYDQQSCTTCLIDEYDNAGTCTKCSTIGPDPLCGRCSTDGSQCLACYGDVPFKTDGTCGCQPVEFLTETVTDDIETSTCVSCLKNITNCNSCEFNTADPPVLECTECRSPYFVDQSSTDSKGTCVREACAEFDANF
jgi:hypothetical protein